jgi:hypothetical protein
MSGAPEVNTYTAEDELADLIAEFPIASSIMPLPHFASIFASPEAVGLAIDISIAASFVEPVAAVEDPLPSESGALNQWRQEVASGVRKKTTMDALWEASVHECNAREELAAGLRSAAIISRRKALAAAARIEVKPMRLVA